MGRGQARRAYQVRYFYRTLYALASLPVAVALIWLTVPQALAWYILGWTKGQPLVFYWFDLGAFLFRMSDE